MWFIARSVYTTEYSNNPPAWSRGSGDLWNGLLASCGHLLANARRATRWGFNALRAASARDAARRMANIFARKKKVSSCACAWSVHFSGRHQKGKGRCEKIAQQVARKICAARDGTPALFARFGEY